LAQASLSISAAPASSGCRAPARRWAARAP
jgi:hypothetical protein